MSTTAITNLKGGVGKSLTTNHVAHAAAARGRRVLVVDADHQGNTTKHLTGIEAHHDPVPSLADVLDRRTQTTAADAIIPSRREGIDVLPSGFGELHAVQDTLVGKPGGEMSMTKALRDVTANYDHVLIDCRPDIDLVTRSAIYASDNVVIVVQPELDAVDGLDALLRTLDDIAEYMDRRVPVAGILINRFDARRDDHKEVADHVTAYAAEGGYPLLGPSVAQRADISRLANAGMGLDEFSHPPIWMRMLEKQYGDIAERITA